MQSGASHRERKSAPNSWAEGSLTCMQARASRGVHKGTWYFEIKVAHLGASGHCRLGWSTKKGELQARPFLYSLELLVPGCCHITADVPATAFWDHLVLSRQRSFPYLAGVCATRPNKYAGANSFPCFTSYSPGSTDAADGVIVHHAGTCWQ